MSTIAPKYSYSQKLDIEYLYWYVTGHHFNEEQIIALSKNFVIPGALLLTTAQQFSHSKNISHVPFRSAYYAKEAGYVHYAEEKVFLFPMLLINQPKTKVELLVPSKHGRKDLSFNAALLEATVGFYSLPIKKITELQRAKVLETFESGRGGLVPLLLGTPAKPRLAPHITFSSQLVPFSRETHQAYLSEKEIEFYTAVEAGQLVGEYQAGTEGAEGVDVYGKALPIPLLTKGFSLGVGLDFGINNQVVVSQSGYLRLGSGGVFSVRQLKVIEGDLLTDFNHQEPSDLIIKGSVKGAVVVTTKGSLVVFGGVEEATLYAKEELIIKGGVNNNVRLCAGGSLEANFASSSTLVAGENIIIRRYLLNCNTLCGDRVTVCDPENGKVIGGTTYAGAEISVRYVGSRIGLSTKLGVLSRVHNELASSFSNTLEQVLVRSRKKAAKYKKMLGTDYFKDPVASLQKLSAAKKKKFHEVILALTALLERTKEIEQEKLSLRELPRRALAVGERKIQVSGTVYEGSQISIYQKKMEIRKTLNTPITFKMSANEKNLLAN